MHRLGHTVVSEHPSEGGVAVGQRPVDACHEVPGQIRVEELARFTHEPAVLDCQRRTAGQILGHRHIGRIEGRSGAARGEDHEARRCGAGGDGHEHDGADTQPVIRCKRRVGMEHLSGDEIISSIEDEGASFEDRWQVIGRNRRRDVPKRVLERLQVRLPLASDVREVHLLDRSAGVQPEHHAHLCERGDHEPCDTREHRVVVALLEEVAGVVQQPQPTLDGGNRPRPIDRIAKRSSEMIRLCLTLDHVVLRALTKSRARQLLVRPRGQHDDRQRGNRARDGVQCGQAFAVRQTEVEEHGVEPCTVKCVERGRERRHVHEEILGRHLGDGLNGEAGVCEIILHEEDGNRVLGHADPSGRRAEAVYQ